MLRDPITLPPHDSCSQPRTLAPSAQTVSCGHPRESSRVPQTILAHPKMRLSGRRGYLWQNVSLGQCHEGTAILTSLQPFRSVLDCAIQWHMTAWGCSLNPVDLWARSLVDGVCIVIDITWARKLPPVWQSVCVRSHRMP